MNSPVAFRRWGRRTAVAYLLLFACSVAGIAGVVHVQGKLRQDEHGTCVIQSRGLRAQRHLTAVIRDIGILLEPVGRRSTPNLPPESRPALEALRAEAQAYAHITAQQPRARRC